MIAAVILAAAAAVFFFQVKNRTSGTVYAIVEQDSKELMRLPLSEPGEYRISDGDSYNVIEIAEGGVRMKEAGSAYGGSYFGCHSRYEPISVTDRKSTRLNSSHSGESRMPSSA